MNRFFLKNIFRREPASRVFPWLAFVVALLALLPLFYLITTPLTGEASWTDGTAKLYFAVSSTRVVFPNQCLDVMWNVEGIKTVQVNGEGRIGTGTAKFCNTLGNPDLRVELQDGSIKELPIQTQKLYREPVTALLLIGGVVALALAAYSLIGMPAALAVIAVVLTTPALLYFVQSEGFRPDANDYLGHMLIAQRLMDGTGKLPPHFLYHLLSIEWVELFPGATLKDAALVILIVANVLTCLAVYAIFRLITEKRADTNWKWTLVYLTIPFILFIGPINFDQPFIMVSAYVYPNSPHSPTFILLKPFAVGLFACLAALFGAVSRRGLIVAGMIVLSVLATLAKPNYTLPFVAVVGLVFAASFIRPLPVKRWELIAGIIVPAGVVLGWQYLLTYGPQQNQLFGEISSIRFSPLELFLVHWHVPAVSLIIEFIISLVFPIVVYGVYFQRARRDLLLNIAWLTFIAGQALGYLFIESPIPENGNMVWGGRITSFVLFIVSIAFFWRQNRNALDNQAGFPRDGRFYLGAILLMLHIMPNLRTLFY